jgi:hypothetical protein
MRRRALAAYGDSVDSILRRVAFDSIMRCPRGTVLKAFPPFPPVRSLPPGVWIFMTVEQNLQALAGKWAGVPAGERANYQMYLTELAEALDVPRPQPRGSGYEFEYGISEVNANGSTTPRFIDLYRHGHFVLEAKNEDREESSDILMLGAFGQARRYANWVDGGAPPYLMALDVAKTLIVWDRWSGRFGDFHAGRRINLATLHQRPDDIALLRDIWTDPSARDPRGKAERVTKAIATRLADLARSLEDRGQDPEEVARFLIRCVFTMFAEDVGLLPDEPFRRAVEDIGLDNPDEFGDTIEELWRAMDEGGRFGLRRYLRFNGHFFKERKSLPLTRDDLLILRDAARAYWADVEPTIMGTLLTRALDPEERHRLGAEYTPRAYVERLVRPTVEEPIRERWTRVQVQVAQLLSKSGKSAAKLKKDEREALDALRDFHTWLRGLRFLDPACGSGNFLYVTMDLVKGIELEVIRAIESITGTLELSIDEVNPSQFFGIEVKAWAREIAELTLWIGFHQWWRRTHGHIQPPEPVLRDTGTLELRDAVLAWDDARDDPRRARPDPTPRIVHPVTGNLVPDPAVRLPYIEYHGARQAEWPGADFIVGNPPYMGQARQREAFGDGYVDALRAAYPEVPDSADYVMYWWHRAAQAVAEGQTMRAGLITTESITQAQNRRVMSSAAERGARVLWAVPDHAWCDGATGAEVRVTMTVIAKDPPQATLVEVEYTRYISGQTPPSIVSEKTVPRLNLDLTVHADVASAGSVPLLANEGLSSPGYKLHGAGFILPADEAERLLSAHPRHVEVIKAYRNGKDLTARPRGVSVIDFGTRSEVEAREYPVLFDLVRSRVKPERDANARSSYRDYWWRYGEPRRELRRALQGLPRYVATVETAKHSFFVFLDAAVAPDNMLVCIAVADAFALGVLSSGIHRTWALAAGGALEDKPRYNKTRCFDPFPFPNPSTDLKDRISLVSETLDHHRRDSIARDDRVTMTGMYNVLQKLRSGDPLTPRERAVHDSAACGVLNDLHVELDRLVAEAYGWPWPMERDELLERLVALHDERVEEERRGHVRWLRPEYQVARFGRGDEQEHVGLTQEAGNAATAPLSRVPLPEWPTSTIEQIRALQDVLASSSVTVEEAARRFDGARREHVARHLGTLVLLGEAVENDGFFSLPTRTARAA